jgi:ubiquitin carboxyl-terminal hydrolase 7
MRRLFLFLSVLASLFDSLRSGFGEPELLSVAEGNRWWPEKGADKVNAHKGSTFISKGLPSILQFRLKRFDYDWQTDTMTKLNNRFAFPEELDLSSIRKDVNNKDDALQTKYDLQSILLLCLRAA